MLLRAFDRCNHLCLHLIACELTWNFCGYSAITITNIQHSRNQGHAIIRHGIVRDVRHTRDTSLNSCSGTDSCHTEVYFRASAVIQIHPFACLCSLILIPASPVPRIYLQGIQDSSPPSLQVFLLPILKVISLLYNHIGHFA
jgi:hypothetical protein